MTARVPTVGTATDIWGDVWDVYEERPTAHGWSVLIGYRQGAPRGRGAGGRGVVITDALEQYLSLTPRPLIDLPIHKLSADNLRARLGLVASHKERHAWWLARAEDLATLTFEEFSRRHGVSLDRAAGKHRELFGRRHRSHGWWREPEARRILLSDEPHMAIGLRLGINAARVGQYRARLIGETVPPVQEAIRPVAAIVEGGICDDAYGDRWEIHEVRDTIHGWPIYFGWPAPRTGRGGQRVILTEALRAYLIATRAKDIVLPIGGGTIAMLRRRLLLHWQRERQAWWEMHADDLATLTPAAFAAAYGVTISRVSQMHTLLFGPRQRPNGWWREAKARLLLVGDYPRAYVADVLGISIGAVGRLRWVLRTERDHTPGGQ